MPDVNYLNNMNHLYSIITDENKNYNFNFDNSIYNFCLHEFKEKKIFLI